MYGKRRRTEEWKVDERMEGGWKNERKTKEERRKEDRRTKERWQRNGGNRVGETEERG